MTSEIEDEDVAEDLINGERFHLRRFGLGGFFRGCADEVAHQRASSGMTFGFERFLFCKLRKHVAFELFDGQADLL